MPVPIRFSPQFLTAFLVALGLGCQPAEHPERPNIVLVFADDLGYGELGAYGQELIETPNLDQLAGEGMLFTNFYSGSPVCAPSRSILLTGQHAGHTYIRGNHEWTARGDVWDLQALIDDPGLEGQFPLADSVLTLGEVLQDAGYHTGLFGKWGLGAPGTEGDPLNQGFDRFYGYNCQRVAHSLYPPFLWDNDQRVYLDNPFFSPRQKLDPSLDPHAPESYATFQGNEYGPARIHEQVLEFVRETRDRPFFLYYANVLPHLMLAAPKEKIEYYREKLGPEEPYTGDRGYTPTQYPRATYAAMISSLDQQVGELIATLKEVGAYENSLIIFTSDNGVTYNVGGVQPKFFKSAGPLNDDYDRLKGHVYEGGIKVPALFVWPGKTEPGSRSDRLAITYDLFRTICEIAGVNPRKASDGRSLRGELIGHDPAPPRDFLYWEFPSYGGQQAVRLGKWKGIRRDIQKGHLQLELYDLEQDPEELNDLSGAHPDLIRRMEAILRREHVPSRIDRFRLNGIDPPIELEKVEEVVD